MTACVAPQGEAVKQYREMYADISECGQFRYALTRSWGAGPRFIVVGLNPSTADGMKDDPTIRRCVGFARREGYGSLVMLNLFAFRATKPSEMFAAIDPIGPRNAVAWTRWGATECMVIAAWGAQKHPLMAQQVSRLSEAFDDNLACLGVTKSGAPRHPLYLPLDAPIIAWPVKEF
jgi:hypothetical protein